MNKLPQQDDKNLRGQDGYKLERRRGPLGRPGVIGVGLVAIAALLAFVQPMLSSDTARVAMAVLFQCAIIAIAVLLCGRLALSILKDMGYGKRDLRILAAFVLLIGLAGLLFLYFYFRAERDIKIYDAVTYWTRTIQSRGRMEGSILSYLSFLRDTIAEEYNSLIAFPLVTASYAFGSSFTGYAQSVFLVYYLPACLFLALLALRLVAMATKRSPGIYSLLAGFSVLAMSPVLFWPLILGYADIAGVLVIALLLHCALGWDGTSFSWKRNVILAALSLLLILSRRWYAYYIVGFYAALGLVAVIKMLARRDFTLKKVGLLAANLGMIAGLACLAIQLLNPAIFTLFFGNNYAEAYAAYGGNGIWKSLWYIANHIGFLLSLAFVLGSIWLLRKKPSRFAALRLLLASAIASVLFLLVQDMGAHHEYLAVPTALVVIAALAVAGVQSRPERTRRGLSIGLALALLLNFSFAYVPALGSLADFASPLTTTTRSYPRQLENYDAYHQIYWDLVEKTEDKASSVYIVGEGGVMNPEYFRRINMPAQDDAAFVAVNNIVDLRDGFPSQLFFADYILMADPFSTNFSAVQQVGYQVYDMLLNDPRMADYYELAASYPLEGHEALLYRKIRPVDKACVDILKERLRAFYPDTPFVYEPAYMLALMEYDETMVYYNYYSSELVFSKPPDGPARFTLNDTAQFSSLSFELDAAVAGLELVVENQSGEIYRGDIAQGRAPYSVDIRGSEGLTVSITGGEGTAGEASLRFAADSLS